MGADVCMGGGGGGGAKPNKSVRLFSHTTAVVVLLFLQCVLSGGRLDYIAFRRIL